jgi:hypothetical protein
VTVVGRVFYLGERQEWATPDFDGQVRTCEVLNEWALGSSSVRESGGGTALIVSVSPPFPVPGGDHQAEIIVVVPGELAAGWETFVESVRVDLFFAHPHPGNARALRYLSAGDMAPSPERLPPLPEAQWHDHVATLRRFIDRERTSLVPEGHVEDGVPLWLWVANERFDRRMGFMSVPHARELSGIEGWTWDDQSDLDVLRDYVAEHRSTDVPAGYRTALGRPLGWKVGVWRDQYRNGWLSSARVAALESVPYWHW